MALQAWTTNRHIYLRELKQGNASEQGGLGVCITEDNCGYDTSPLFSPDGNSLAWYLSHHIPVSQLGVVAMSAHTSCRLHSRHVDITDELQGERAE